MLDLLYIWTLKLVHYWMYQKALPANKTHKMGNNVQSRIPRVVT